MERNIPAGGLGRAGATSIGNHTTAAWDVNERESGSLDLAFSDLVAELGILEETAGNLFVRLSPVLDPVRPEKTESNREKLPERVKSQYAEGVLEYANSPSRAHTARGH